LWHSIANGFLDVIEALVEKGAALSDPSEYEITTQARARVSIQDITEAILYGSVRAELMGQLKSTLQDVGVVRDLVGIIIGYMQELSGDKMETAETRAALDRVRAPKIKEEPSPDRRRRYW
jgi:hypothetical protein